MMFSKILNIKMLTDSCCSVKVIVCHIGFVEMTVEMLFDM